MFHCCIEQKRQGKSFCETLRKIYPCVLLSLPLSGHFWCVVAAQVQWHQTTVDGSKVKVFFVQPNEWLFYISVMFLSSMSILYTLATLQLLSSCFVVLVPFQGRSLDSDTLKFIFLMKRRVPKRELPDSQTQMWWSKFIPKLWEGVTEAACMSMYVNATVFSENLTTVHIGRCLVCLTHRCLESFSNPSTV